MSKKKKSVYEYFYAQIVPRITSVGAAVVIVGALFKIMHWPGAGTMLTVGLLTEAFLFFLGVAMPIHDENERPDWSKVYPQLADPNYVPEGKPVIPAGGGQSNVKPLDDKTATKLQAIDKMIADKIKPENIDQLGKGMNDLSTNVAKMTKLADASVATGEYAKNVKLASNAIVEMNKSYQSTIESMKSMSNASNDVKAYQAQLQKLTQHLGQLNQVYEAEVKNTDKNVKAMGAYYGQLAKAMENVSTASKDAETFKNELAKLTTNLTSLNKVYGGMLAAMKS